MVVTKIVKNLDVMLEEECVDDRHQSTTSKPPH